MELIQTKDLITSILATAICFLFGHLIVKSQKFKGLLLKKHWFSYPQKSLPWSKKNVNSDKLMTGLSNLKKLEPSEALT